MNRFRVRPVCLVEAVHIAELILYTQTLSYMVPLIRLSKHPLPEMPINQFKLGLHLSKYFMNFEIFW